MCASIFHCILFRTNLIIKFIFGMQHKVKEGGGSSYLFWNLEKQKNKKKIYKTQFYFPLIFNALKKEGIRLNFLFWYQISLHKFKKIYVARKSMEEGQGLIIWNEIKIM